MGDGCLSCGISRGLACLSPIVCCGSHVTGELQRLDFRRKTNSGFRLLFFASRQTSFCHRPRVTSNEQADQHPSLGALFRLGQKLTVLHLLPVTCLNQSEAPARTDHGFHQPRNDAVFFVSSNTACSLEKTPDGFLAAFQAGTRLRSSQQNIVSWCLVQKQSIHISVLNLYEFRDLGMDIVEFVYIR